MVNVIYYQLTLLEPLLVSGISSNVNSYFYLPGSAMRGALVGAYMKSKEISDLDATDPEVRHLFFDGTTRYLNAYPANLFGRRMLPTPFSWTFSRGQQSIIIDRSLTTDYQLQPIQESFCWKEQDEVDLIFPHHQINVQNAGFTYLLAPGQQLSGIILVESDRNVDIIVSLLKFGISILGGGSRTGYGRVEVKDIEVFVDTTWREISGNLSDILVGAEFVITLLSDAIVRHPVTGQYISDISVELTNALQLSENSLELVNSVKCLQPVGGFNRKWGLPLPQAQAIMAGSTFVYNVLSERIQRERIHHVERNGIGERRVEGFGRLAFNWQTESELYVSLGLRDRAISHTALTATFDNDPKLKYLATNVLRRILRQRLNVAMEGHVRDLVIYPHLNQSQLNKIRHLIRKALMNPEKYSDFLLDYLENEEQAKNIRIMTKGSSESFLLVEFLKTPELVNREFSIKNSVIRLGDIKEDLNSDHYIALEYALRLIDGLLQNIRKTDGTTR